jgi:hypothetical protein
MYAKVLRIIKIPGSPFSVVNSRKRVKNKKETINPIPAIDSALSWIRVTLSEACLKAYREQLISFQTIITPKTMKRIMWEPKEVPLLGFYFPYRLKG